MNLPHPDAAIKGRQLVDFLLKCLCQDFPKLISVDCFSAYQGQWSNSDGLQQIPKKFSWIIDASGRAAAISQRLGSGPSQAFGHRCVIAQEVILLKDCEETNYWIETVTNAWILLAPLGGQRALLQVMVPYILATPAQLLPHVLKQSLKIKQQISDLVGLPTTFSAFPQILPSLSGPIGVSDATWIAVGDAAFCVDPISGDGTGYAIREAILATSIINRMSGNPAGNSDGLHHYSLRLRQAFLAHLQACMSYYSASFSTLSWDAEIGLMRKAFADHIFNQYQPQKWMQRLQGLELIDIGNPII
jgi:flavin-dependent dehydrogenase